MTPYEMLDYSMANWDAGINCLVGYFSTVSAYLLVAYLIGEKLTRAQTFLVSGLFTVMASYWTWGVLAFFYLAEDYGMLGGESRFTDVARPSFVSIPILIIGILSSLKFLWDIRHPKSD